MTHSDRSACRFQTVPPSPQLLADLYARYLELKGNKQLADSVTFTQFFNIWSTGRRGEQHAGLDDGRRLDSATGELSRIDRPAKKLKGAIKTIVLLIDFPDQPHQGDRTTGMFDRMLFSVDQYPTGSMRDYYRLVSGWREGEATGIDVVGKVHGWFRMPHDLSFYADNRSGLGNGFPRNAQGMARDAVIAAKAAGVDFSGTDALGQGIVTALFVVHAGRGTEETGVSSQIWSHKSIIPGGGIEVAPGIQAVSYLTVPEDCKVGVCAHEWGHLAGQWADYYDTEEDQKKKSSGLGDFCLMASGSWGDGGLRPTMPNGMLRMFHEWIRPDVISTTRQNIVLKPAAEGGTPVIIRSNSHMTSSQYIMVEYRRRRGQDSALPGEGVAVYVVDEAVKDENDEERLAIELLQADNLRQLALVGSLRNRGDSGDLYPFNGNNKINRTSKPPLNFPGKKWSGVEIVVHGEAGAPTMSIDVKVT